MESRFFDRALRSIAVVLLLAGAAAAQEAEELRIPFSNPEYQIGDWTSYTTFRYVNALAIGSRYVYFATTGGITRYNLFSNEWDSPWTISDGLPGMNVTVVAYDVDTDVIWCATEGAVSYRNPTSRQWQNFYLEDFGLATADPIVSIGVGTNSVFFEAQSGTLIRADKYGGGLEPAEPADLEESLRWFGARAKKIKKFPLFHMSQGYFFDTEGIIRDFRLRDYPVTCAAEDPWSQLWLGTWGISVGRADLRLARLDLLPVGPWQPEVRALVETDNEMWMGGLEDEEGDGAITIWNKRDNSWAYLQTRYVTGVPSDRVLAIATDGPVVWFGTELGLVAYDRAHEHWRTFEAPRYLDDDLVYDVLVDSGWVLAATGRGVSEIRVFPVGKGKKDSVAVRRLDPANLSNVAVYDLEKTENLLWAGTSDGLYVYDREEKRGGYVIDSEGPMGAPVSAVGRAGDTLWVASWKTVYAYDMRKRVWLPPPMGRTDLGSRVYRISGNDQVVWFATEQGVYKYDYARQRWRRFAVEDGLIGSHVYTVLLEGDYVWFGTNRGITRFYWNSPYRAD